MVYGGTIKPGFYNNQKLDIVSAFQCYGQFLAGEISEEERSEIVRRSCPGAGACGGMYTANTMATAIEAMGMSLPYSASIPAEDPAKKEECRRAGAAMLELLKADIKPRDIMTRAAFENAMVTVMALGGSTNAVLHLIAMARSVGRGTDHRRFPKCQRPHSLSGRPETERQVRAGGSALDRWHAGGHEVPARAGIDGWILHDGDRKDPGRKPGVAARFERRVKPSFAPISNPIKSSGHIRILKGSLAPEGAVAKITGKEGLQFTGPARCFDSEEAMLQALEDKKIQKGDVVVIRYEGPKGGPGMPEMLTPTSAIMGAGLGSDVAMLTDGRFSGGSHGFIVGHITPEAQLGGPLGLLQDGDT